MASAITNRTARDALAALFEGKSAPTIHMLLLTGTTTNWDVAATLRDLNFAEDITADEMSDGSYSREAVANLTSTIDNPNDRGELDHDDVTFADLSGSPVIGVAYIEQVTNDADSPIRGVIDLQGGSEATPNGEDLIVRVGSEGVVQAVTT